MVTKARDSGGEYDPVLTPEEAAARLNVSVKTLERWTRTGKIGCKVLPSGHRRYPLSVIEACLQPFTTPRPPSRETSRPGRAKRLPGVRQGTPRALQAGVNPRSRLAAVPAPPGARPAQPPGHQRDASAGPGAARAPGGPTPVSYGRRA